MESPKQQPKQLKKVCPNCGSTRAKAVQRENQFGEGLALMFVPDYICKECDTQYAVQPTRWKSALLPLLIGFAMSLFGLILIFDSQFELTCFGFVGFFLGGPVLLALGIFLLIKGPGPVGDAADLDDGQTPHR